MSSKMYQFFKTREPERHQNKDALNPDEAVESIPTYSRKDSKLKGKALLINNIIFNQKERCGAEKDGYDLDNILKMIGFSCHNYRDLSVNEMKRTVAGFSKEDFITTDVSLIVIMSYGTNSNVDKRTSRDGCTDIVGMDGETISIDEIIDIFTEEASELEGKPKIFIFQCCRDDSHQIDFDAVSFKTTKQSDILIAFSTLTGFVSNKNPNAGTPYIQSICEVFSANYKNHHVEDMLKIVNDLLSKMYPQQAHASTYESRGFKNCYLYPQK